MLKKTFNQNAQKPKRKTALWVKLALTGALGVLGFFTHNLLFDSHIGRQCDETSAEQSERRLSTSEQAFMLGFFGSDFDTSGVLMHYCENDMGVLQASAHGISQNMMFYGMHNHHPDYADTPDGRTFSIFSHEMLHLWQYQEYGFIGSVIPNNWDMITKTVEEKYYYTLNPTEKHFDDYGMEQQGAMIQDYTHLFLHKDAAEARLPNTPNAREDLKIVIEERFPGAREMRLYFEANGHLPWQKNNARPAPSAPGNS